MVELNPKETSPCYFNGKTSEHPKRNVKRKRKYLENNNKKSAYSKNVNPSKKEVKNKKK